MIEGLKVTIKGAELKQICRRQVDHHAERVNAYAAQISNLEQASIEGMGYSGGDPKQALRDKMNQHTADACEMEFIAAHLVDNEDYILNGQDLIKLGISKRGW